MKKKINENASEKPIGVANEYWIAYEKAPFVTTVAGKYAALIRVTATNHDANLRPTAWAIYGQAKTCLNKKTREFDFESAPSQRNEIYVRNYRFATAQEAIAFFRKHFSKGYVFIEA